MQSARIKVPSNQQNLMCDASEYEFLGQPAVSLTDMVFGFVELEDWSPGTGSSSTSSSEEEEGHQNEILDLEDEEKEKSDTTAEKDNSFWEKHHQLVHATLCRTSSLESRIRSITKEALREIQTVCGCGRRRSIACAGSCRNCLMTEICGRLRNAGYINTAICKTKWRSSPDIPSGEHNFIDVVDNSSSKSSGEMRVIIELNFRAEFEIAKASEVYNQLLRRLPEVFVGKVERLNTVVEVLCLAAKKCMKEKKMHLGPWRKRRYMLAKWLATPCERSTSMPPLSMGNSGRRPRQASMLTVDLKDMLPNVHCTAVAVSCK